MNHAYRQTLGQDVPMTGANKGDAAPTPVDGARLQQRTVGMSDLLGAAPGLYGSVDEVDAEIARGREERTVRSSYEHSFRPASRRPRER